MRAPKTAVDEVNVYIWVGFKIRTAIKIYRVFAWLERNPKPQFSHRDFRKFVECKRMYH